MSQVQARRQLKVLILGLAGTLCHHTNFTILQLEGPLSAIVLYLDLTSSHHLYTDHRRL